VIDTHCHVHDRAFDEDRDDAIARAQGAGVHAMITIGEDLADSRRAIETAQRYGIAAAPGVHPHRAAEAPSDLEAQLSVLLDEPGVVALGEIGLDYYYEHSPRAKQLEVLRRQLHVAKERGIPVIFHQRDAFDDFTAVLRDEWRPEMRGVVHCFTGTAREAAIYRGEFGLLLGIGGVVTFPKAQALREAVVSAGTPAIVLETDCPYLAPAPMRGRRNEPAFLPHTAGAVAALLGEPLAALVETTDANAHALFGI
jgi:TatD DNase family protein